MGVFLDGLKGSHSQMLAPFRHGRTRRWRGPFPGFPSSSCCLWSVSWYYTHILYYFFNIPQLPLALSSTSWPQASRSANSCQQVSKEVRGRDLQQLSVPSFCNAQHFSFSMSSERCDVTEVNTPHIKAAIYRGNCFSCEEKSLSISGPKNG